MSGFLDANVVVRYITRDVPESNDTVRQIIEETPDLVLTEGIIGEIAFVLSRNYLLARQDVVDALVALLQRTNIEVYNLDTALVIDALMLCRPSHRVSFADAMLWAVARSAGTNTRVYSLDKRFPRHGIELRREP
ncbi:MAG TPA: PIN domain-containing protein [Thermomicrobiaceae bacterium]|nr:PIN domain-containing protein [Thermomicrobiaceae bacterium]